MSGEPAGDADRAARSGSSGPAVEDIYPLSPLQQGILFHALYAPAEGFYFQQLGWQLRGEVDAYGLRRAWARVIDRHAVLRTTFAWKGRKEPLQVVLRRVALPWSEIDWRGLEASAQARALESLLAADRRAGFRLDRAPLLRLRLMDLGGGRYHFLFSYHHLLLDGWSVALLLADVFEIYRAGREGRPARLPAARGFGEYVAWLQGQDRRAEEDFWRRTLAGLAAPPTLPQRLSFGEQRQGFAEQQHGLDRGLTAALRQLTRQTRTTLNLVMQAVWALLLHHYTGAGDLLFGATLSGRSTAPEAWSQTVGVLANTVPVRARVAPRQWLDAWLRELQEAQLEAFCFEHTPLVDVQRWSEVPAGTPLFDSLLAFENFPVETSLDGRTDRRLTLGSAWSFQKPHYPLALMAAAPDELSLRLLYDLSRFDRATACRLVQHLAALLAACAAAAPAGRRRLEELQPLAAAERHQLILEWNDTASPVEDDACLHELVARRAALAPDRVAVDDGRRAVTYGELAARSGRLAARLAARGVRPGDFVAVLLDRDVEMVAALLAILSAGAAYVPLEPAYPPPRLLAILEAVAVRAAVTKAALAPRLASLLPALAHPVELLAIDRPAAAPPPLPPAPSSTLTAPAAPGSVRVDPGAFAYVIFTSGSTGAPKGVAVRHRQAVNLVRWVNRTFAVDGGDRVLAVASLCFDLSVYDVFGLLAAGGAVRIATEPELAEPARLVELLAAGQVTLWDSAPAAWQQLEPLLPPAALPAPLRLVLLSGDWVPLGLPAQAGATFPAARVVALGGATEAVVWSNFFPVGAVDPRWISIPYGRPIERARYHVLDDLLRPCAIGVDGGLYIGGDCLAWGYWGDPALTAAKFQPDPFAPAPGGAMYSTGDRARHLPDGNLEFLGRRDQQVKVRGFRVETGEVEAALREHPGVHEAVVLARGANRSDQQLAAFYIAARHPPPAAAELAGFVAARLPHYMVPAQFVPVERFPATANGKLDRRALAAWTPARTAAGAAPGAPLQELLAGLWQEVLGVPAVRRGDDFFALGGHSLLATRLLSRLRQVLGVELSLRDLFEQSSLGGMLRLVEAALGAPRDHSATAIAPLPAGAPPPLSFAQERLWFLDQLEPGGAAYNIPFVCRLRGPLSLPALAAALQEVVRRHQVLRSTFPGRAGEAAVAIAPAARSAPRQIDLAGLPAVARRPQAQALARQEAALPFDLARGPLLRTMLARLGPGEHLLLVTMHHIVSDGWSVTIFVRELAALYQAGLAGLPSPFPELPLQYADFAAWQRQALRGEAVAALAGHWRQRLGEAPATLDLPLDRPRPERSSGTSATVVTRCEPRLAQRLLELGRGAGVTLFMTLLAGWLVQLSRLTGQRDLCVGTPIAGRNRAETEGLIGLFVNTLPLRVDLSTAPTFRQLLARVREVAVDAYVHQDLPFEQLVLELAPPRSLGRTPFFQVFFNMLNLPVEEIRLSGLVFEPVPVTGAAAKFDLTLYAAESEGDLRLEWSYRADLFDAARIAEMARQLEALLEQAAARPEAEIGAYSLLTAAARAVLPDPAAALAGPVAEQTVDRSFAAALERSPDAVAVVDAAGCLTYGGLDRESGRLAAALRARGVAPGDLAAIDAAGPGAALVVALLGAVRAGAAFLILDPEHPAVRLAGGLRAAHPAAWIDAGPAAPPGVRPGPARPAAPAAPRRQSGDLAYLIFTSGSGGAPRGILAGHGPLAHFLRWHEATFELAAADRFAMLSGLAHDPLLRDVFTPLRLGATLCVPPPGLKHDPARLRRWLAVHEVSVLHLTPGLADLLCAGAADERLPALRHAFFGGDRLTHGHVARLRHLAPRVTCANFYGATETPQAMAWHDAGAAAAAPATAVPIGRGIEGVQLLVAAASGLAGVGEPGEILVRTAHLAFGYLGDPAATAERFTPDPGPGLPGARLYRTGDLGRYLPDGAVELLGRADDQANVRGVRVEPAEVAAALASHAGVRQAFVLARRDGPPAGDRGDARLTAWFVAAEPAPAPLELRQHLLARLPEAMVPESFIRVADLPLNANGKVDRRRLLAAAASEPAPAVPPLPPLTPVREMVAAIWSELLPGRRIAAHDDFFALGGHSLLATQAVSRLRAALGTEVSLLDLFAAPTVAGLAATLEARLRGGKPDRQPPIRRVPRDQPLPLSAAQRRLWFLDRLHPGDPSYNVPSALRLAGVLDVAALTATVNDLLRRHESLRTRFVEARGMPFQEVVPEIALALPVVDLAALGAASREREAARVGRDLVRAPFDLGRAPLLRCLVVRLGSAEHATFFAMHHIVSDGWSMGILVREVAALYRARLAGGEACLPPLPVQYADFAAWQQRQAASDGQALQLAYWMEQVKGAPPLVEMPVDRLRPPLRSHRGASLRWRFAAGLRAALAQLQQRERVTLFMILLAAFQALLHWYRGQDDFVVGTDVANRTRLELEGLIGCFVNQLPLRARFAGLSTFAELLRQASATTLGAYAHQDLPHDHLVESLRLPRSLAYPPIIQAKINLYNFPMRDLELPGLVIEPWAMASETAKLDLILDLLDTEAGLQGSCHYSTDLFDAATIERLWGHLELVLARVAVRPEVRLDDLASMLGAADRERTAAALGRFRESRGRLLRQRLAASPATLEKELT